LTVNLFDLTYQLASELGIVVESTATGGSATTLEDSVILTEADDHWNKGTVWILKDAAGASALPEGQYAVISDFDNGNNRCTIGTITAVASGDTYAITDRRYKLGDLIMAINRAIRDAGYIPVTDTTTVDTAAAQTEYDLPIAANHDLRTVEIETNTSDADDNQFTPIQFDIQHTAVGTADLLVFHRQPPTSRDVKLVYMSPHVKLVDYDDKLSESVPYERVIYRAVVNAMRHYQMKTHEDGDWFTGTLRDYVRRADKADLEHPIKSPKRRAKGLALGRTKTVEKAFGENTI